MLDRIENSPEYEAKMEACRKDTERKKALGERAYAKTRKAWEGAGRTWMPMEVCPFQALDDRYDKSGVILVTDGKALTVASVSRRFGTPVFWKTLPDRVYRDGVFCLIGGEEDPRDDLPKWWWEWEIKDALERETWAYGEPAGQPEVEFVPTLWTFLPDPPQIKAEANERRSLG